MPISVYGGISSTADCILTTNSNGCENTQIASVSLWMQPLHGCQYSAVFHQFSYQRILGGRMQAGPPMNQILPSSPETGPIFHSWPALDEHSIELWKVLPPRLSVSCVKWHVKTKAEPSSYLNSDALLYLRSDRALCHYTESLHSCKRQEICRTLRSRDITLTL